MKNGLPKGILSASVLAARVLCHGQVYSQNIPSFAERNGLAPLSAQEFLPALHEVAEVRVTSYTHQVGSAESCTEWYTVSITSSSRAPWGFFGLISMNIPTDASGADIAVALIRG